MTNLNNNLPPIEEVIEIKYQVPSFEEFMKDYKVDENLNYDDLNSGSIGEVKGYGPCSFCCNNNKFKLRINLKNCIGGSKWKTVHNTNDARDEAKAIMAETGHWEDSFWDVGCFSQEERWKLANKIWSMINRHEKGHDVDTGVCNKDESSSRETGYTSYEQVEIMNFYTKP